jgi:hypothetical protein
VGHTTLLALVAAIVMALPIIGILFILKDVVPPGAVGYLIRTVAAALAGGGVYFLLLRVMNVKELALLQQAFRRPPVEV